MGMFDYVRCHYAVPGDPHEDIKSLVFQTKDLSCEMAEYTITDDGRLVQTGGGFLDSRSSMKEAVDDFSGDLSIYTNNIRGSGPGLYTEHGEPAHSLEYKFLFVDGRVQSVKEVENKYQPAAPIAMMRVRESGIPEETQRILRRRAESLVGRDMYLLWGGQDTGYPVKVVAENARQLVVENPDGLFEKLDRGDRDHLLWDTESDAMRARDERKADWQRSKDEFNAYVATAPIQSQK
jgi:hypothetical protein